MAKVPVPAPCEPTSCSTASYKMCQSRAWVKMAKTATQMAKTARGDGVWTVLTRLAAHELHMNGKNSWLQAPGYWMP
ncbi:GM22289 [Drosophila sechellia]|uniref:GM22289 n=1 Tax=Drosophila sechellia TaxID=7238 RepID=B4IAA2_DROSE|nr:GM22289 [Drosophila sechellia]